MTGGDITCWSVAGFDGGGGAGLLADLETFRALGVRGAAAITAVTAQGRRGVARLQPVSPGMLSAQIACLLELGRPAAIKIGMLGTGRLVRQLARELRRPQLRRVPVVLDPVLRASAGGFLLPRSALGVLRRELVPRATVITPNAGEAAALLGRQRLTGAAARNRAARRLLDFGCPAVVLTGGDGRGVVLDVVAGPEGAKVMRAARVPGRLHGTGCRFSAALAVWLARGKPLLAAARLAAAYTRRFMKSRLSL